MKTEHITFNNSDFFNYFYQNILSAETLADFEATLMTFMSTVLKQNSCIFYSNIDSYEDKCKFILQRDSYSQGINSSLLKKTFPTLLTLESNILPKHPLSNTNLKLAENFFSLEKVDLSKLPFLQDFQKYSEQIRCGMLLRGPEELHGILLYEKPICHPYLNNPFRLQQLQEYLSLALMHRETLNYATLDQLTYMHRKHYFLNQVEKKFADYQSKNYQILMIDIDYFKKFNDDYGHLLGDECLYLIAKAIKHSLRNHDLTARFGGEEFICLIQSDKKQIFTVAERIHKNVTQIQLQDSKGEPISAPSVSIGVADFCIAESLNNLIERADKALYRAKLNGRNQTFVYEN